MGYFSRLHKHTVFWADYIDTETVITPISVAANTWTEITNDKLGAYTEERLNSTITQLWANSSENRFDFSDLIDGDDVKVVPTLKVTPTSNSVIVKMRIAFYDSEDNLIFDKPIVIPRLHEGANVEHIVSQNKEFYVTDYSKTLNAKLEFWCESSASVVVEGIYIKVTRVNS